MSEQTGVVQPRLGAVGWLRWIWRQLTSMRTALQLLLLLAVAAIPGSVLPQRRVDASAVGAYLQEHTTTGPWLDRIGGFDVYASPWFSAIYLLLFISLVGCVIPRTRVHFRAMRARPPRTPSRLERMPAHARATLPEGDPTAVLAAARTALRRRRYRIAPHGPSSESEPDSWAGEKGYASETGNLLFHLSLLGLLIAVAFGSFLSYSGQVVVVVGDDFANTLPRYDSFSAGTRVDDGDLPPFSFTLDRLDVTFSTELDSLGAPRDFDGDLTVRETPTATPEQRSLRVNHPVNIDGAKVYLVGNGYAPVITVRDAAGKVVFSQPVVFRAIDANYTSDGVVKIADGLPDQLGLVGQLLPTAATNGTRPVSVFPDATDPRLLLGAWKGTLYPDGAPQSVYVLKTDSMTQLTETDGTAWNQILAPGGTVQLPDGLGSVTFDGLKRYAALDVRADPTKRYVLVFAVLGLTGLVGSLFVRRRRVWVRVRRLEDGGVDVEVAGLPRREDARLEEEITQILAELVPPGAAAAGARTLEPAHLPEESAP